MTANLARDLYDGRDAFGLLPLAGPVPDDVLAGLAKLATSPPIWGSEAEWLELTAGLQAFSVRWFRPAAAAGWSVVDLFGLCPVAPRARLSRMGAAFLACLRGHHVVEVDHRAITMVTRTSSRLRVFRGEPDAGVVLAWELCRM